MTILHSGTTKDYSDNWSRAFSKSKKASTKASAAKGKLAKKKSAKKSK